MRMDNNRDLFGVSLAQLRSLVSEGLKGGSWCDLYFEQTSYNDLLLRDSVVASGGFHLDYGCGIRVLDGEKTGYAYSESTDYQSLLDAARAAAALAGKSGAFSASPAPERPADLYPVALSWDGVPKTELARWLERLEERSSSPGPSRSSPCCPGPTAKL